MVTAEVIGGPARPRAGRDPGGPKKTPGPRGRGSSPSPRSIPLFLKGIASGLPGEGKRGRRRAEKRAFPRGALPFFWARPARLRAASPPGPGAPDAVGDRGTAGISYNGSPSDDCNYAVYGACCQDAAGGVRGRAGVSAVSRAVFRRKKQSRETKDRKAPRCTAFMDMADRPARSGGVPFIYAFRFLTLFLTSSRTGRMILFCSMGCRSSCLRIMSVARMPFCSASWCTVVRAGTVSWDR